MICPACGKTINDESIFCGNCGARINNTEKPAGLMCPNCNVQFDSDMTFCNLCGTKLVAATQNTAKNTLEFEVTNTFKIPGLGVVVTGKVLVGKVVKGDTIYNGTDPCQIVRIEQNATPLNEANKDMEVGMYVKGCKSTIEIGSVLIKPAIDTPPPSASRASANTPNSTGAPTYFAPANSFADNNKILMQLNSASIYYGRKSIGAASFSGTVYIYADRIETEAALRCNSSVFLRMDQIASVTRSQYMIAWASIIFHLKDGTEYTLACTTAGSATIEKAIQIIRNQLNK